MELQILDQRPPLAAVVALAKANADANLPKWRDDMGTMSAEVARKYFGALTEDTVQDGVDACVNLLSIGLLRSTGGGIDAPAWLETLRAGGVRGVSKLAVELIKTCDALPTYGALFAGPDPFRPSLLILLLSYASRHGAGRAFQFLLNETDSRAETRRQMLLAEWFLSNTASGRVAKRGLERFFGSDQPDADAVIHHIVSLSCGLKTVDPYADVDDFMGDEDPGVEPMEFQIVHLPAKKVAEARARYDLLIDRVPPELKSALMFRGKTWFERFVAVSGKKAKIAKPDDEEIAEHEEEPASAKKKPASKKAAAKKPAV